jgi:transcriptional regulator with GAF, ATPase, and Fis domain
VVERAVITARGDALDLAGALPQPEELQAVVERAPSAARRVLTVRELHQIERDNLLLALEVAGWRVSGPGGAAELLGINASTLSSRIKALRIERQRHPTRSAGRANARRMEEARYV